MLGNNFMTFENVAIPNPDPGGFSIDYENIENEAVAEDGSTVGTVTTLQKRTFNLTVTVSSKWFDRFLVLTRLTSGTLVFRGESIEAKARITSAPMIAWSQYTKRTDGLWTISISISEIHGRAAEV